MHAARALVVFVATILSCTAALSQTYPVKPVRLIVPFPAGGGADIFARLIGRKLGEVMGQQFVADNRAGASGMIGCELAARAAPDGYTLLMATTGTHTTNPAVYAKMPYDPVRDFSPISLVAESPFVLIVHPSLPARSVKELIAFARKRPGELTYGSSGVGSSSHLGFELFNTMAGIKGIHVPYKGLPAATADTIAGHIVMSWDSITAVGPHIRSGRVRALGIGSGKRSSLMPDIPTISEAGLKGFELGSWYALFGPAGMRPDTVSRLHGAVITGLAAKDVREQFSALGAEAVGGTPGELAAVVKRDIAKWAKVARAANVKAE
jgi:tripartite-type tricarboxylate transporter receptor subunit TctC